MTYDYNRNPLPEWKAYQNKEKNVMKFLEYPTPDVLDECPLLDHRLEFGKETYGSN